MIGLTREGKLQIKKQTIQQEKLFEGKVFKNHRAMCDELGWEYIDSTNSKKAQLKVLSQYCEWYKQGQKIIIGKAHGNIGQTTNSSRMTESKLIKLGVQYNLLRIMLSDLNEEDIEILNTGQGELLHTNYFVMPTLQKATGLVGDYYYVSRHHQEQIAEIEEMPVEHVYDFFNCTHKKITRYITESLEDLKSKRLLTYSETKKLTFSHIVLDDSVMNRLKQTKKAVTKRVYSSSFATKGQLAFIMKCEREIMDKFGLTTFNQIYSRSKKERKRFFSLCVKQIRDNAERYARVSNDESIAQLKDLHKYAKCYEMTFVPNWIQKEMQRVNKQLSNEQSSLIELLNVHTFEGISHLPVGNDVRQYVNDKNVDSLKRNVQRRHDNAKGDTCRTSEDYVSNGNILIDNYVSRSCKEVREKLEEHGLIEKPDFNVHDSDNVVTVTIEEIDRYVA